MFSIPNNNNFYLLDVSVMFVWIGAAVDISFKVHKLLTTLPSQQ
jgi:hypothetical protein